MHKFHNLFYLLTFGAIFITHLAQPYGHLKVANDIKNYKNTITELKTLSLKVQKSKANACSQIVVGAAFLIDKRAATSSPEQLPQCCI